jgi:cytochrome c oxidase cbb3-type subunit IV
MKADSFMHMPFLDLLATWWTPVFVGLFIAVLVYALRPRNAPTFDAAAKMPLRED